MKKKLILIYFVLGCVWTIINLPNLLAKTNNNAIKATGLAIFRIIAWPILLGKEIYNKAMETVKQKQEAEAKNAENDQ